MLVKSGVLIYVAAEANGVSRSTVHVWMKRGERRGKADAPYRAFAVAIEQARAEAESDLVARMRQASSSGSWRATAWLLERMAPERWARARNHGQAETPADQPETDAFAEVDQLAQRRACAK